MNYYVVCCSGSCASNGRARTTKGDEEHARDERVMKCASAERDVMYVSGNVIL